MKAHLTRRYIFSASHRLHSDELSEEENRDSTASATIHTGTGIIMRLR